MIPYIFTEILLLGALVFVTGCGFSNEEKLIVACQQGNISEINTLLKEGTAINYKDHSLDAGTPLIWAVRERQEKAVEVLLSAGADPNIPCGTGETALFFAIGSPTDKAGPVMIKDLILAGADTGADRSVFTNLPPNDPCRIAFEQTIAIRKNQSELDEPTNSTRGANEK